MCFSVMVDSKKEAFYVAQVKSMKAKEIFKLEVDFSHVRTKDRDFSHYVCNNRARYAISLLSVVLVGSNYVVLHFFLPIGCLIVVHPATSNSKLNPYC